MTESTGRDPRCLTVVLTGSKPPFLSARIGGLYELHREKRDKEKSKEGLRSGWDGGIGASEDDRKTYFPN